MHTGVTNFTQTFRYCSVPGKIYNEQGITVMRRSMSANLKYTRPVFLIKSCVYNGKCFLCKLTLSFDDGLGRTSMFYKTITGVYS